MKLIKTLILLTLSAFAAAQIKPIEHMPSYNGGSKSFSFAAAETENYYYLSSPQFYAPKNYAVCWNPAQNKALATPFLANAAVHQVISDGKDGFFIVGDFTQINGVYRPYLAHLNANFSLDYEWNPNLPNELLKEIELWKNTNINSKGALSIKLSSDGYLNILCSIDQTYDGSFIVHNPPTSGFWRLFLNNLIWKREAEVPNATFVPSNNPADLYIQSTLHQSTTEHTIEVYCWKKGELTKWKTIDYKIAQCPPVCFVHGGIFHSVGVAQASDFKYWRSWNTYTGAEDTTTAGNFERKLRAASEKVEWYLPQEPQCENCTRYPFSFRDYVPLPDGSFYIKNYVYYPQAYNQQTTTAFVWSDDNNQFYETSELSNPQIEVKQQPNSRKYYTFHKQNTKIQQWDFSKNKLQDFWAGTTLHNNKHNSELGYKPHTDWVVNAAGQLLLVGDFTGVAPTKFSSLLRLRKSDLSVDESAWNPLPDYVFTDLHTAGGKLYARATAYDGDGIMESYLVCVENPDDDQVKATTKKRMFFNSFVGSDQTYLYWSEIILASSPYNNILCRKRIADAGFKKIEQHKFFGWVKYVSQDGNFWQLTKADDYLSLTPIAVFKSQKNKDLPLLQLPTQGLRYILVQDSAHFYSFVSTTEGNKLSRVNAKTRITEEFWIDNNHHFFGQQGFVQDKTFYISLNESRQNNLPMLRYDMETQQTSFFLFTDDFQEAYDNKTIFPMQKGFFLLSNFEQLNGLQVPSGLAFVPYTLPSYQHIDKDTAVYAPEGIRLDYEPPFLAWNAEKRELAVMSLPGGYYSITLLNEQNVETWKMQVFEPQNSALFNLQLDKTIVSTNKPAPQKGVPYTIDFSTIPSGKYRLVLDLSALGTADKKYILPKLYYNLEW